MIVHVITPTIRLGAAGVRVLQHPRCTINDQGLSVNEGLLCRAELNRFIPHSGIDYDATQVVETAFDKNLMVGRGIEDPCSTVAYCDLL